MKRKTISILMVAALGLSVLAGCGGSSSSASSAAPEEAVSAASEAAAEESAAGGYNLISQEVENAEVSADLDFSNVKIGEIESYVINDGGFCQANHEGIVNAMNELGIPEENLIVIENIYETDPASIQSAAEQLIEEGCQIIFSCSTGYSTVLTDVAAENPEILIAQYGTKVDNLICFGVRSYEGMFLAGYASELLSQDENTQLGFSASFDEFSVRTAINAYTLGAQYANEAATVKVACADTWYDIDKETQCAQSLIDAGIKYMGMEASSPAIPETCEKNGAYVVGYHNDMSALAPDAVLVSFMWNFAPIFKQIIVSAVDGSATTDDFYYWGGDCASLSDFADFVPAEIQDQVAETAAKLASGEISVYGGELKDRDGNVLVEEGQVMDDEAILLQEFYVEGVDCAW